MVKIIIGVDWQAGLHTTNKLFITLAIQASNELAGLISKTEPK